MAETATVETFVISDPATLKVLSDIQRLRVLFALADGPRTVKDIASAMAVPPTRLYYHMRKLESHGLVRVHSRRMVSGIEERTYAATAENWTVAPELFASALVASGTIRAMFDLAAAELSVALERDQDNIGTLVFTRFWLTDDQVEDVRERLGAIMEDYHQPSDGAREYHGLLTFFRRP